MDPALDVSWTAPADNGITIGSYDVQYRQQGTSGWTAWPDALDSTANSLVLEELPKGKVYEVQVRAVSDGGIAGPWSDTGSARTNRRPQQLRYILPHDAPRRISNGQYLHWVIKGSKLFRDQDGDELTFHTVAQHLTLQRAWVSTNGDGDSFLNTLTKAPGKSRITYSASDAYGGKTSHSYVITGYLNVKRKVVENSPAGASVGKPVTGTPLEGETLTYTLTGAAADYFEIDPASGQITVSDGTVLNRTATPSYTGKVEFTVGGKPAEIRLTIEVVGVGEPTDDEDDPPGDPDCQVEDCKEQEPDNNTERSVEENSPAGTAVGDPVTATDPDGGTLTYTLSEAAEFDIDPATGQISVAEDAVLNYEATESYTVTVSHGDATTTVAIAVTDVDEPPDAPDAPTVTGNSEDKVTASWTVSLYADRPPITNHDLQYRKQGDTEWTLIEPVGLAIEYPIGGLESNTFYEAQVRAINDEGRSEWSETGTGKTLSPFIPNPTPTPPPPPPNRRPVFEGGNDREVAENSPAGTAVGAPVTATDDDGDTLTYSLSGAAEFVIDPATGQIGVADGAALDYEATLSYTVTVSVSDGRNNGDATATVTIAVTDVAEPPNAPDAPTVTGNSEDSVTASWTLGVYSDRPAIADHDLQYRKQGDTEWTQIESVGMAIEYTIGGLESGTFYEAQVRAINDEGRSGWSETGTGGTFERSAPPPPDPDPPEPTPAPTPEPTPAPTPEPTPAPTPQPTPAPTPQPTPAPTPEPTPAPTPEPTPTPTPEPTPAPTPEPTPAPTPTPEPTPAPTLGPTPTPELTPAPTPQPTPAPTLGPTPELTPAPTPQPEPGPTLGPTAQPTPTPTPTPTPQTPWWWIRTAVETPTPTPEPTPTPNDPEENGPGNPSNLGDNQAVINSGSGGNTVIGPGNPRNSGGVEPRNPRNDAGIGPGNLRNFGGSAALGNVGADGGADDSGGDNGAAVGSSGFGLVDWAVIPAAEGSLADANDLGETPPERNVWHKVTDDRLIPIWWWLLLAIALAVAGRIAYKVWRDRMERDRSFF